MLSLINEKRDMYNSNCYKAIGTCIVSMDDHCGWCEFQNFHWSQYKKMSSNLKSQLFWQSEQLAVWKWERGSMVTSCIYFILIIYRHEQNGSTSNNTMEVHQERKKVSTTKCRRKLKCQMTNSLELTFYRKSRSCKTKRNTKITWT